MKILLDTHILVWVHTNDKRLSEHARSIISSNNNVVYYSPISIWESEIKHSLYPSDFSFSGKRIDELSRRANLNFLPFLPHQIFFLNTLKYSLDAPKKHKDPFDRILICQAKSENMLFLTHDELIPYYNEACIISV